MSNALVQCLRSISPVVDPLDHGLLVLTLASQNTWNAPSEIIPTWNLRNDLHYICPKLKFPAKLRCFHSAFFSWNLQNPIHICCSVIMQCMLVLHGNRMITITPESSYRRSMSQKWTLLNYLHISKIFKKGDSFSKFLINTGCYVFIFRYCLALNTGVKYWNLILQLNVAFLSELNCTEEYRNWILIYELQPPTRRSTSIIGNKLHNVKKKYWEFPYSFIGKSESVNVVNATYVNSKIRRLCSLHSSASEQKYIQEDPFTFTSESIPWSTLNAFIYDTYSRKFWDT